MRLARSLPCMGLVLAGSFWAANAQQGAGNPPADDCYKPVAPVESLMEAQDMHFAKLQELMSGTPDDRGYHQMEHQANILAELGNVNRHEPEAKKQDYLGWATDLRDQSVELAAIAAKKDLAGAKAQLKKINDTCAKCHDVYKDD